MHCAIKTPAQDAPYSTSQPFNDHPAAALNQAITGLVDNYEWAIDNGYTPQEDWLVPALGANA